MLNFGPLAWPFALAWAFVFLYEGAGWLFGKWPTITQLSRTRPYLRVLIVLASAAWLAWIVGDVYPGGL